MPILESLAEAVGLKKRTATRSLSQLAEREATGKSAAADAEKLIELLSATGKTIAQYQEMVEIFKKRDRLAKHAAAFDSLLKEKLNAEREIKNFVDVIRPREWEALRVRESELRMAEFEISERVEAAAKARNELDLLSWVNAEIMGIERPDLDDISPTCRGASVGVVDGKAPAHEVPPEVFTDESARRSSLYRDAITNEQQRYERESAEWNELKSFGENPGPRPKPAKAEFSWPEIRTLRDKGTISER